MVAVRRLYLFIVSAISLGMVTSGAAALGGSVIDLAFGNAPFGASQRAFIATSAAVLLVGLPVWALHWSAAQRLAVRDPAERSSTLRRLYLYVVLAALLVTSAIFASRLLEQLLDPIASTASFDGSEVATAAWQLAVVFVFWRHHSRIADVDREAVGEARGSATLRRWYVYGVQFVAVLSTLFGARELLISVLISPGSLNGPTGIAGTVGRALAWLVVWVGLARWTGRDPLLANDRSSTLRAVQSFLVVGFGVALVLSETSRLLYYLLATALGVESPGGIASLEFGVLAGPLSTMLVFGGAWAAMRSRLRQDAGEGESPRQAGARRLYQHLVAFLALATLATGLATLLDTLLEASIPPSLTTWRDVLSFALTLIAVGLPLWLLHWKPQPVQGERFALSRRLYLFATLAGCVLALLIGGATLIKSVLDAALAASFDGLAKLISPALSAVLVASVLGAYHWRILRQDGAERALAEAPPKSMPSEHLVIEVSGATEADLRQALASLPGGASYSIRSAPRP